MDDVNLLDNIEVITEWPVIDHSCKNSLENEKAKPDNHVNHLKLKRESTHAEFLVKRPKPSDDREILANVSLAKWWRQNQFKIGSLEVVKGCNPNTLIKIISRLPEAITYINDEINRLREKTNAGFNTGDIHAALGTFLEKSGNIGEAVDQLQEAVKIDPKEKEYQWLLHKMKRIFKVQKIQLAASSNLKEMSGFPSFIQVKRRSANNLTVEEFINSYECTSTPVIITDQKVSAVPWTMEHIREIAGNCQVVLKKPVKHSVEWARLENSKTTSVKDYINDVQQGALTEPLYLFDWSLPINCPQLAEEIIIPKFFAGDFLKRTSEGSLYRDSWPSLFVAPAGITSELHVDAFGSNFWMALFQGRKRWVFFPKTDVPYLYPEYEHSLDPVFDVDLSNPDLEKHPLVQLTTPIECIHEPGEVLFVPAGCPHRVENLEPSVAISSNFVDKSNFYNVIEELTVNSLLDVRSKDLLEQFLDPKFDKTMDMNVKEMFLSNDLTNKK